MWIRSMNKRSLVKINNVALDDRCKGRILSCIDGIFADLGTYQSEERALEVLDMIQSRIIKGDKFDSINRNKRVTKEFVFQMPEK